MNVLGKVMSSCRGFYQELNAANLTGAIDVLVVQQPDGRLQSTPFHVRFGKLGVLRPGDQMKVGRPCIGCTCVEVTMGLIVVVAIL